MKDNRPGLTEEEKSYLLRLARWEIARRLERDTPPLNRPDPRPGSLLEVPCGAFVTLHKGENLRGCIGFIEGIKPLEETVREMAPASAFRDPRFPPLTAEEYPRITIEISALTPLELCPDPENPDNIQVGTHGLYIRSQGRSGLLLPQVPLEQGWEREEFLDHTCLKAGVPPGSWKRPETEIYTFTALVLGEES